MDQAAALHRASFDHPLPVLAGLHTPEEDRWFFRERMFATCQLWGYFDHQQLIGIIAFREGWVDQLYVLPSSQRRVLAPPCSRLRKANFQLSLWTFQRNKAARRFYEKQGFTLAKETDGSANEEKEPTPCTGGHLIAEPEDVCNWPTCGDLHGSKVVQLAHGCRLRCGNSAAI